MIMTIWAAIKAGSKFLGAFKWYIYAGTLIAGLITLYNYVDNHGEMKAELSACNTIVQELYADNESLIQAIRTRDERIAGINAKRLAELAAAKIRLDLATQMSWDLLVQMEELEKELAVTRFNTLEAIRDDEDFADWANEPVPVVGWSLLRQATESSPSN